MKNKSLLSKLNRKFKYVKNAKKNQKKFLESSRYENAVPWDEIKKLFKSLQTFNTEYDLIRLGSNFDGGYLVPNDLKGLEFSFSPGVSDEIGFDLEMSKICKHCFLSDASVNKPSNLNVNMTFIKKFIGNKIDPNFIRFEDWVSENAFDSTDLLLQMDIEGAEYDILPTLPEMILKKFRIILIEFHDFDKVFNRDEFEKIKNSLKKLEKTHLPCHFHANNTVPFVSFEKSIISPVFEMTYIRKDRVKSMLINTNIPHPLDQPNTNYLPNVQVPNFWY
ncbi:FkbM family methyltransferase [Amylibacter sp.]|nr:FkbM family methyltransferase [Amylibacter sp.]